MSKSYTWGSSPQLTFTVSDTISRSSSSSTYYSGTLTVTFGACSGGSYFGYYIDVTVNGTTKRLKENTPSQWTSLSASFSVSGSSTASSITITGTLGTNAERGSATFSYTTSIGSYSSSSGSGSGSSTPTAGASSISLSAASCKLGESVTINLNRGYSGYTHTLTYSVGGASYSLASNVATSVTWTPPTSLIDSVNSGGTRCTITATTYYGSTSKGQTTASLTLYPPDGASPTVSDGWVSVERDNSAIPGVDAWVKGYSRAKIVFDESQVTGNYDATITGFSIRYGGVTTEAEDGAATTGVLAETSATVLCTVTDSRGNYTTEPVIVPTLDYALPTVTNISAYRSDEAMLPADEGLHITAKATAGYTTLDGANSVTLTARYRALNGTFGDALTLDNNTLTLISGDADISTEQSYVVQLTATDALGNATSVEKTVPTRAVTFHLKSGGTGAAFGKIAETETLDCQWPAHFRSGVSVDEGLTIDNKTLTAFIQEVVTPMLPKTLDIDAIYPVGSIYMSLAEDADPNDLFAGTVWEQITGRFLLASSGDLYELGSEGGAASVTLTTNELPNHNHVASVSYDGEHRHSFSGNQTTPTSGSSTAEGKAHSDSAYTFYTSYEGSHTHTVTISSTGGNQSHENMPPYLVVHMWKRTN